MTRQELNTQISTILNNNVSDGSVSPEMEANAIKLVADYVDGLFQPQVVKVSKRIITSAELLGIFNTPINLVNAVAGKILIPMQLVLNYSFGTVAYQSTGNNWKVNIGDNHNVATFSSSIYLGYNIEQYQLIVVSQWTNQSTPLVNTPITLTANANFVGGDGTVTAYLTYQEITL